MSFPQKALPVFLLLGAAAVLAAVLMPGEESVEAAHMEGGGMGGFLFAVTFAEASAGRVTESVDLVGDVVSARRARLAFDRGGPVEAVFAEIGDEVRAGTVLARLDDNVLREDLEVLRARAKALWELAHFAERDADRGKEMGPEVFAEAEQDKRVAEAAAARFRAQEVDALVRRMDAMLLRGELKAPFDSVVTAREITDGSYAAMGETAFEVVDLVNLEIHLEIPTDIAAGLPEGAGVSLRADELEGFVIETRLDRLVPSADPATRTFLGIVELREKDPAARLMPGMFVRARIVRWAVDAETIVPADAVLPGPQGSIVVKIVEPAPDTGEGASGGRPPAPTAEFVQVRILSVEGSVVAVASIQPGQLKSGDRVVVTGVDNVFPGAPLAPTPHSVGPADRAGG